MRQLHCHQVRSAAHQGALLAGLLTYVPTQSPRALPYVFHARALAAAAAAGAIASANANPSLSFLYFPPGSYHIASPVTITKPIIMGMWWVALQGRVGPCCNDF